MVFYRINRDAQFFGYLFIPFFFEPAFLEYDFTFFRKSVDSIPDLLFEFVFQQSCQRVIVGWKDGVYPAGRYYGTGI